MVFATAHQSFAFLIVMAQVFGVFPLDGVTAHSYKFLQFRWLSFKILYTLIFLGVDSFESFFHIYNMIVLRISLPWFGKSDDNSKIVCHKYTTFLVNAVFVTTGAMTNFLFLKLAMSWPSIMKKWTHVDIRMLNYGFPKNLMRNMKITAAVFMFGTARKYKITTMRMLNTFQRTESFMHLHEFILLFS